MYVYPHDKEKYSEANYCITVPKFWIIESSLMMDIELTELYNMIFISIIYPPEANLINPLPP